MRIFKRIKSQGVFSTFSYLFISVFLEKLKIEIHYAFEKKITDISITPNDIVIYTSFDAIPAETIQQLTHELGEESTNKIENRFSKNAILATGFIQNKVASLSWLVNTSSRLTDEKNWLIFGCYTLSKYRGHGFYPKSIAALCQTAYTLSPSDTNSSVIMNVSICNKTSINGIKKCGFTKRSLFINFRDRLIYDSYRPKI